jgi:hypothetical protein
VRLGPNDNLVLTSRPRLEPGRIDRMQRAFVEKFGSIGAIIAAAACPICFPKLALIGSAVGLGVLAASCSISAG